MYFVLTHPPLTSACKELLRGLLQAALWEAKAHEARRRAVAARLSVRLLLLGRGLHRSGAHNSGLLQGLALRRAGLLPPQAAGDTGETGASCSVRPSLALHLLAGRILAHSAQQGRHASQRPGTVTCMRCGVAALLAEREYLRAQESGTVGRGFCRPRALLRFA